MIQDVFLPEKIGEYYIFSQRFVGIDITKSHVNATLIKARGSVLSIDKQISEQIQDSQNAKPAEGNKQNERTVNALASALKGIGKFDHIRTALPSSVVVFKEMRLPFTSYDKINMVIRFEVEPLLPFPAQEALVDFIISEVNEEQKSAQVLVAAVQKKHLQEHLSLFEQAGYSPSLVTVDMFALYGLYTQIPAYAQQDGAIILLDLDINTTRVVAIDNGQLRIIRTLPYGIASIAKQASTDSDTTPAQALEQLMRFGSSDTNQADSAIKKGLESYFNKIQFALSSTIIALKNASINKLYLVGAGAQIHNIIDSANQILEVPCELFDIQKLAENKRYRINKSTTLTPMGLLSVAIAAPCPVTHDFNLARGEFAPAQTSLMVKQMVTSFVLVLLLFGSLITNYVIQTHKLSSELYRSQSEAVEALQERFPSIPEDETELAGDDGVLALAKQELENEEKIWMAFSGQARASFLEYLLELSSRINKQQLGFNPQQLTINEGAIGEITLKARVRDFDALKQLEQILRQSKLFSYVEGQTTPDFSMKIVVARKT